METEVKKISIKDCLAKFFHGIWRILIFFVKVWANTPSKEHEPTMHERYCGKKLVLSDEYYIPNQKPHK